MIPKLSEMLELISGDYARNCRSFELDDTLVLSPHAAVVIAERLCRVNPTPDRKVMEDETEARHKSKHGYQGSPISRMTQGGDLQNGHIKCIANIRALDMSYCDNGADIELSATMSG